MWERLLVDFGRTIFRRGHLTVELPSGRCLTLGDGGAPKVSIRIEDEETVRRIVTNPELGLGEAYMDGRLTIANDDIQSFLALGTMNYAASGRPLWRRPFDTLRHGLRWLRQFNPSGRARSNVAHHYDLSAALYDLFLDADRQYSCAYFTDPGMTLEDAQLAKKRHIAGKLLIERDAHVLDIGCGWGGMALTLAQEFGARVTGVTLSEEQHALARERVRAAGLEDRIDIRLCDYRHLGGTYDRIVSVGMFEHVGVPHYREYFRHVHDMLKPDGVALIHTIGRVTPPGSTSPWIEKYIFPGGYIPSMSEMIRAVEKEALYTTDIEYWRLHYARTLRHWFDRFSANADKAAALYDARFVRMWRFYLAASEQTFRHAGQCVFQIQLAHRQEAVPLTRDYLYRDGGAALAHAAE